jgi:hypothetical protein
MPTRKAPRGKPEIVPVDHDLPTVPEAFRRVDYEGWPAEIVKSFQLKRYQKTQAQRIAVLKQINQIQGECLALARNETNWRHFGQEDRIRQKRLDLEEMELDLRLEDRLYEQEQKRRERAESASKAQSPAFPKKPSLVEEITTKLDEALRTKVAVKTVFDAARREHPGLTTWLDDWEQELAWDLKERKWF